ncbi:hypothetical protein WJ78_16005 [Burkholderia ubonensis]|nr:hypothetical protein WJ78_16005 [Burkholderia ubonensis]KVQ93081.1 hypothetical protein WK08_11675 [Burkholderia ubonensis]KWK96553.1 hypothetical protein WM20_19520 [Burkholderia ubonensis]KWN01742.1 hypothetical protein WM19_10305 [Burkholderia ubonensis]KWN28081.1 hypothetical protein WM22_28360 [Burkholderia ubonensis]
MCIVAAHQIAALGEHLKIGVFVVSVVGVDFPENIQQFGGTFKNVPLTQALHIGLVRVCEMHDRPRGQHPSYLFVDVGLRIVPKIELATAYEA